MTNVEQIKRAKANVASHLAQTNKIDGIRKILEETINTYHTITGMAIYDSTGVLQIRDMKMIGVQGALQEQYYIQAGNLLSLVFRDLGEMKPGSGAYKGPVAEDLGAVQYIQVEAAGRQFGIMPVDEHGSVVLVGICSDAKRYVSTQFRGVIGETCQSIKAELA